MESAFAIEFDLTGSFIMDRGINFAGLLARLIADRGEPDPLPKVPLGRVGDVFAGSDLFILGPSLDYHLTYVRSLRPTAMPHDLALYNGRSQRRLDQITLRDERKNLLDTRRATSANTVVAFGCGDIARIRSFLSDVSSIGAKRSSGYGTVNAVRVTEIDHPHAGIADREGYPLRPVPVETWRRMNLPQRPIRNLVAQLPRWNSPYEPCVGPREWTMEIDAFDREVAS
jgi:hypothetical protein